MQTHPLGKPDGHERAVNADKLDGLPVDLGRYDDVDESVVARSVVQAEQPARESSGQPRRRPTMQQSSVYALCGEQRATGGEVDPWQYPVPAVRSGQRVSDGIRCESYGACLSASDESALGGGDTVGTLTGGVHPGHGAGQLGRVAPALRRPVDNPSAWLRRWWRYSTSVGSAMRNAGVSCRHRDARLRGPRDNGGMSSLSPEIAARLKDPEALLTTVVQDETTREVLMVAWMDTEALHQTLTTGRATYFSRSRQERWVKGETSGNRQWVREASLDCDGDTLLLTVQQEGPACHTGTRTCFVDGLLPVTVGEAP